jgi:hypothetical protein
MQGVLVLVLKVGAAVLCARTQQQKRAVEDGLRLSTSVRDQGWLRGSPV